MAFGQGVASLLPQLSALTEILPPPTLAWKLQLLQEGNRCAHHHSWSFPCLACEAVQKFNSFSAAQLAGVLLPFTLV